MKFITKVGLLFFIMAIFMISDGVMLGLAYVLIIVGAIAFFSDF